MDKVAVFGGTFDPVHLGHTACIQHLLDKMNFSKVYMVPTGQNPLKVGMKPSSSQQRLDMIWLAMKDFGVQVAVDESEIHNPEPSYTSETIKGFHDRYQPEQLYLIMGMDVFQSFNRWKNYSEIFESCNILVVSRPPYVRPYGVEEFPEGLQDHIYSYDKGFALMKSGRSIEFVRIDTEDISSSQIRKKLKTGKNVQSCLSMEVEKFIVENDVYPRIKPGAIDFGELTMYCGGFLNERAMNASGYDLRNLEKLYDYTLIASANSTKQAQSLATNLKNKVKEEYGLTPFGEEGKDSGRWVILDYGGLIVHVLYDFVRHQYHLEQLWADGKRLTLPERDISDEN